MYPTVYQCFRTEFIYSGSESNRIRIQHFRLNTSQDPGIWRPKVGKYLQLKTKIKYFLIKISIYLSLCLLKGRPSYRRSLQSFLLSWNRIPDPIRIRNTCVNCWWFDYVKNACSNKKIGSTWNYFFCFPSLGLGPLTQLNTQRNPIETLLTVLNWLVMFFCYCF